MEYLDFEKKIKNEFDSKIGIEINDSQCQAFFDYMNLLIEKNKVMNLTAITEPDEIIVRHFVDSCMMLKFYGLGELNADTNEESPDCGKRNLIRVIDVGTGAGFPGLPLAIMCPSVNFVLTDTLGKRINFLQEVVDNIGAKNVKLVKARAEDLAHDKEYREGFDFCLSRGVSKLVVLAEYSLPFVKNDGNMIAWKLDDCKAEANEADKAIKTLGGMFHVKHSYRLIDGEPDRCLLEIGKTKPTPKQYPRKAGTPTKDPIT